MSRPRRIIDTADIDVSKPPRTLAQENRQQRHRLRRDRPTIKIRSQALKDNPALREYNEKHEKTVGELLVEKFLIKDKQQQEGERKMKLYHQASLMPNDTPSLTKEHENDILAAIRRRVTRRMTRRRSSADVVPLDPEQIEREAALHAAQAEALDSLVAEEQAEIEVEVRRGTFAKKQAMRLPMEISEVSETEEDDELEEEDRKDGVSKKHVTTKKKKRRKIMEKPLPCTNDEEDDDIMSIAESVIEEEEFEWDDREKCDDVRAVIPSKDEKLEEKDDSKIIRNDRKIEIEFKKDANNRLKDVKIEPISALEIEEKLGKESEKVERLKTVNENVEKVKLTEPKGEDKKLTSEVKIPQDENKNENLSRSKSDAISPKAVDKGHKVRDEKQQVTLKESDATIKEQEVTDKDKKVKKPKDKNEKEKSKQKERKTRDIRDQTSKTELNRLKRTVSAPQKEIEGDETTHRFKVEASNSVGDFSTLYVKAANSPAESVKSIEQFRESIRLPAPRRGGPMGTTIETEIVLPVRKPYVRDTSRNSVYLALKPSQNIRQRQLGADDRPSIIIDETRKESSEDVVDVASIDSRPAKCAVIDGDRSKIESDSIISEERDASTGSNDATSQSSQIEPSLDNRLICRDNKPEVLDQSVDERIKKSAIGGREDFVSWWDEIEETPEPESEQKHIESKVDNIVGRPEEEVVKNTNSEIGIVAKVECEKKIIDSADTHISQIKALPVDDELQNNVHIKKKTDTDVVPTSKHLPVKESLKNGVEVHTNSNSNINSTNKVSDILDKPKPTIKIVNKSVKSEVYDFKENCTNKIVDTKKKVTKSASEKEVVLEKKLKSCNVREKVQPAPKVLNADENAKLTGSVEEIPPAEITLLFNNKDESISSSVVNRESSEKKVENNNSAKKKCELPRIDHHYLPDIPEEPKSTSPTERKPLFTSKLKTNDTSETNNNKSLFGKEVTGFSVLSKKDEQPLIKPNLASTITSPAKKEKDERKKKVDSEAIMKIEKKILEDSESPLKILTTAIPETQIVQASSLTPVTKKEEELQSSTEKKVGLLPTKKKSSETAATHRTEIDFWSEIKAQESVKVSGTPRKVQSQVDSPSADARIEENSEPLKKSPEKLTLDLSKINTPLEVRKSLEISLIPEQENLTSPTGKVHEDLKTPLIPDQEDSKTPIISDQEDLKTPLIPDQEDLNTPFISDPSTPLIGNLSELPVIDLDVTENRSSSVIYNGVTPRDDQQDKQLEEESQTPTNESELSGTVKKISKWTNLDNLSNLNDVDGETTPIASKEVSPQVSAPSSTITKKKIVKRKKSATPTKKKLEKGESTKTSTKTKVPVKKVLASPQTSQLKAPMSASGSPRNTPGQRPADLMKLFYTTPAILLTATPRDLRKVRRAKVKRKKPPTRTPSLSSDSTGSTRSTATTSTEEGSSNCEEDAEQKRLASTRSNDSGFDGSPRLSSTRVFYHVFFLVFDWFFFV